jgi:hypothetical protein
VSGMNHLGEYIQLLELAFLRLKQVERVVSILSEASLELFKKNPEPRPAAKLSPRAA